MTEQIKPRMLYRYEAARYMGKSLRKFDEVKYLYRVTDDDGLVQSPPSVYDQSLRCLTACGMWWA